MNITDIQKEEMDKLSEDPKGAIQASLNMHRKKLEKITEMAADKLHESINTATVDQTVKIYDTTRKHLNVLDGRTDTTQASIIVIPQVLINREDPNKKLKNISEDNIIEVETEKKPIKKELKNTQKNHKKTHKKNLSNIKK